MEYPLTTVTQSILSQSCGDDRDVDVVAGNFDGGNGVYWDNKSSTATKRFVVFSYQRDFNMLWGLHKGEGGLGQTIENVINANYKPDPRRLGPAIAKELTLVVIWDGMPESDSSPMNIGGYVTPYDWAVIFSYSLFNSATKSKSKPHIRIFILDLKSQEYSGCFGIKTFNGFHAQFPWIQIYRPVAKESLMAAAVDVAEAHVRSALPVGCLGFDHFVADVMDLKRSLSTFHDDDDENRLDDLEAAVNLWASNLVKPGDRHTVANLIGPIILANGFMNGGADIVGKIAESSQLRGALVELILAIGLVAMGRHGYNASALLPSSDDKFGRKRKLKFVLVDDQYALGFHHVLSRLIFGNSYKPSRTAALEVEWVYNLPDRNLGIRCYNGANAILEKISDAGKIDDWNKPRYLSLPSGGDILLLDLRLWTEDSQKMIFLTSLKKVCDQIGVGKLCEKDDYFRKAYDAIQNENTQDETATLVFLPLLLSYYDPSLPIVLFSSTHQRAVIEMVSHRPNIITDFSKPLLGNYVRAQDCGEILRDLRKALEKAIELHEARVVWERIVAIEIVAPTFFCKHDLSYTLYNVPPGKENNFKAAYGVNALKGDMNYSIDTCEIQKLLAECYQQYILRHGYFDFVTIPWEFIEGNLPEDSDVVDFSQLALFPRNGGGVLLKNIRHKKAHGKKITRKNTMLPYQWRWMAILEFLVLLDFLSQAGSQDDELPQLTGLRLGCLPNMHAVLNNLDKQKDFLRYSTLLALEIWKQAPQSFSDTTKNFLRTLSPVALSLSNPAGLGNSDLRNTKRIQGALVEVTQATTSKRVQQMVNKAPSHLRHKHPPEKKMQPHNKKTQTKPQKVESVFVQSVEAGGFWVTFYKSNIGKVNKDSHPPSGWCPSDGQASLPAEGEEIKIIFTPDRGDREGFCLVRQVAVA